MVPTLAFTETSLQPCDCDSEITWEGYQLFHADRRKGPGSQGGGVALYVKDTYFCNSVALSMNEIEALHVTLADDSQRPFEVFVMYRPPDISVQCLLQLLNNVTDACPHDNVNKSTTLIVGDFNVDELVSPISQLCQNGFTLLVKSPTHVSGSLLDHVYLRPPLKTVFFTVTFCHYCDHAVVQIRLSTVK